MKNFPALLRQHPHGGNQQQQSRDYDYAPARHHALVLENLSHAGFVTHE